MKKMIFIVCLALVTSAVKAQKTGVLRLEEYGSLTGNQLQGALLGNKEDIALFEKKANITAEAYQAIALPFVQEKLGENSLQSAIANSTVKAFPVGTTVRTHGVGGNTINWFNRGVYEGESGFYHEPTKTYWVSFKCANLTVLKEKTSQYVDPGKEMVVQTPARQDTTFRFAGGSMPGSITINVTNTNTNTPAVATPTPSVTPAAIPNGMFYSTASVQQNVAQNIPCNTCPQPYNTQAYQMSSYNACSGCGTHGCQGQCQQRRQPGAFGRIMENAAGNFIGNGALLLGWYLISGGQARQVPQGTPGAVFFQGGNQLPQQGGLFQGGNQPQTGTPSNQGGQTGQYTNVLTY